ncbi:MAG: asparagine synthase (glutamine-hydrolyzing) [Planctomycetes bacterium]|nr:asparagine synthase (glutamine-hydrolyzing) [Planctomycetota bacterium]
MCGIFGIAGERWRADIDRALDTLEMRGPDDRTTFDDGAVHFGHRRLAIIDRDGGRQPMTTPDGRYTLVYNGEVYNFRSLRRELESEGVVFRTRSDTEVVLMALATWGPERALPKLDGIFAFALHDVTEREIWLARDRLGVKPLYWSTEGGLVFASTMAPFWELRGFPRRLDPLAVREYLAQNFIPAPRTIIRDVRALPPAGWLRWREEAGVVGEDRYWDIPPVTDTPLTLDELVEATDAALATTVEQQLVADVPLGAFLSGGIDSSLLVSYMAAASSHAVRTFTVRFDQSERHDESWAARAVAEALGTEHHELAASSLDADALVAAIEGQDQPFGDPSFLPLIELCRLARQHVTVAIGGDGGDELFGGYYRYARPASHYPARAGHRWLLRMVESGLLPDSLHRTGLRGEDRVKRNFSRMGHYGGTGARCLSSILDPEAARSWRLEEAMREWEDSVRRFTGRLDADSLMRADVWHFLSENGLVKTDRASMMHALEVRVPFLGNDVVDLVLPQPASVKMLGERKAVLKRLARRRLPEAVWNRPKQGFAVPLSYYFRDAWKTLGDDLFADAATIAPFFDAGELQRRWAREQAGRTVDWPLYAVLVLLAWLRDHPLEMDDAPVEPAAVAVP